MRVQILGLCRFSYLGGRGFQVEHASIEERRAFLYDPDRLARRWNWFEAVTLPALMAQTDPDFTLVLMTGPDLPAEYMARLEGVCERMPQAKLSVIRPMNYHLQACKHALMPHKDASADVIGHFRMDDDDAVAVDYVERARQDFRLVEAVWRIAGCASVDYMRGLVLRRHGDAVRVEPKVIYNATAALTIYLRPEDERSAVFFPHWKLGNHMPGLVMPEDVMFCRSMNGDNDSSEVGPGYGFDAQPGDLPGLLRDRFRIDLPRV